MGGKNSVDELNGNGNASADWDSGSAVPALDRRERNLRKHHLIRGGALAAETVPE